MALTQTFSVGLDDRGILFEDGLPTRVLPPGQHRFFGWQGATVQVLAMALEKTSGARTDCTRSAHEADVSKPVSSAGTAHVKVPSASAGSE